MKQVKIEFCDKQKNIIKEKVNEWLNYYYEKEHHKKGQPRWFNGWIEEHSLLEFVYFDAININYLYSRIYGGEEVARSTYVRRMHKIWNAVKDVIFEQQYGTKTIGELYLEYSDSSIFPKYFSEEKIKF